MPVSPEYKDYILDQMSEVDGFMPRSMFGGMGLFKGGVMFAIISRKDRFYMKVDEQNQPDYEALGAEPFRPHEGGKMTMPYFEVPVEILDDPEELAAWADKAWEAAKRNAAKKPKRKKKSRAKRK